MDPIIRRAIAKIEIIQDGTISSRGTGTLVSDRLVLTALHVVADRKTGTPKPGTIRLTFPTHTTEARLHSDHQDGRADWALLECAEAPSDIRPVPLNAVSTSGRSFETFGFPDTQPKDGMVQRGTVEDHNAALNGVAVVQLFSKQAAAGDGAPVKGASGSPVIIDNALVGVLRFALMDKATQATRAGTLYACPVTTVVEGAAGLLRVTERRRGQRGVLPYLEHFDHDVVISFARLDNEPDRPGEHGWVEEFTNQLRVRLLKRFGKRVDVWRDRDRDRAELADDAIAEAVRSAGVMLTLISNGYLEEVREGNAPDLAWFREQAERTGDDLRIDGFPRVFPVSLYNIPEHEWPAECRGPSGFTFHDGTDAADHGLPLAPDSEAFQEPLRRLVDELYEVLTRLKRREAGPEPVATTRRAAVEAPRAIAARPEPGSPAPARREPPPVEDTVEAPFSVFMGCPADDLRSVHRQLSGALERAGIAVIGGVPPPYEHQEHIGAATDAMARADLSVHLLGLAPGEAVDDSPGTTYPIDQARLGLEHAQSQLILMPEDWDRTLVEDAHYAEFVQTLRDRPREEGRFELAQVGRQQMLDTILTKRQQLEDAARRRGQAAAGIPGSAFVDLHPKDLAVAGDLVSFLDSRQISTVMVPSADLSSSVGTARFNDHLRGAGLFLVVFGTVARDWVQYRLEEAFKFIVSEGLDTQIGVYAAPPLKASDLLQFGRLCRVADNMRHFDPATIEPLLAEAGGVS